MSLSIKDIYRGYKDYLDKEIILEGWIRTSRSSKAFGFIELNDGTFFKNLQIVYDDTLINFKDVEKLPIYSAIRVAGTLVETPEAKQPFEVKASSIELEGMSDSE